MKPGELLGMRHGDIVLRQGLEKMQPIDLSAVLLHMLDQTDDVFLSK